jgi:uncharacterized cupredoxin-like copper-binding protein
MSMLMNSKATILSASLLCAASPALAGPGHSAAGEPGKAEKVSQTVVVAAKETDDGRMLFEPHDIQVEKGTTVRIVLKNVGQVEHELYLGTPDEVKAHSKEMQKFPEMEHDEPSAVRVDPGHQGEITWEFTKSGTFTFACLIPGHSEMGMMGDVTVTEPPSMGVSEGPRATEIR